MSEIKNNKKIPTIYTRRELASKSVKKLRHLAKTDKIKLFGARDKDEILKIMSEYYLKVKKDYLNIPDTPEISKMKKIYTWKELESKNIKQLKDLANTYQVKFKLLEVKKKAEIVKILYKIKKVNKAYTWKELKSKNIKQLKDLANTYKVKLWEVKKKDEIIKMLSKKINKTYTREEIESKSLRQLLNLAKVDKIKLSQPRKKDRICEIIWRYYDKVKKFYYPPSYPPYYAPEEPKEPKESNTYTQEELQSLTVRQLKRLARVKKIKLSRANNKKEDIIRIISAYYSEIEVRKTPLPNEIMIFMDGDEDEYVVCPQLAERWKAEKRRKVLNDHVTNLFIKQKFLCADPHCGRHLLDDYDVSKLPQLRDVWNKDKMLTGEWEIVHWDCPNLVRTFRY